MSVAIFDNVYDFLTQSRAHHTNFSKSRSDLSVPFATDTGHCVPSGKNRVMTLPDFAQGVPSHPKMNKFEATALRYRQHTLELKAARSRTVFIPDYTPPASVGLVTAAAAKKKAAGPVAAKGPTCTARTLEGRQCTFRVVAGGCFCKKHSTMV